MLGDERAKPSASSRAPFQATRRLPGPVRPHQGKERFDRITDADHAGAGNVISRRPRKHCAATRNRPAQPPESCPPPPPIACWRPIAPVPLRFASPAVIVDKSKPFCNPTSKMISLFPETHRLLGVLESPLESYASFSALWPSHFPARPWPARIRCAALVFRLAFVIEF